MDRLTEQIVERIGQAADRIDNCLAARKFMPVALREEAEPMLLTEIRDELRAIVCEVSGKDPWEFHPKD
jgi:hypothetical protein